MNNVLLQSSRVDDDIIDIGRYEIRAFDRVEPRNDLLDESLVAGRCSLLLLHSAHGTLPATHSVNWSCQNNSI